MTVGRQVRGGVAMVSSLSDGFSISVSCMRATSAVTAVGLSSPSHAIRSPASPKSARPTDRPGLNRWEHDGPSARDGVRHHDGKFSADAEFRGRRGVEVGGTDVLG
jgi:hypothetical protein